jgi:uncharacterized protein
VTGPEAAAVPERIVARETTEPWEGVLYTDPGSPARTGLLVLAGSSGRVERTRARILAAYGLTTLAIRWFGGPGQPARPCEVPLETFTAALDLLAAQNVGRLGILGLSKGAEAAMLVAVRDPRVDAVVALSPPAHAWGWSRSGRGPDGAQAPCCSCWTWQGRPLAYVPMDPAWAAARQHLEGPVAIRGWYDASERAYADRLAAAEIPVEKAPADLVLVAGADDGMWPSARYAAQLAARRRAAGRSVRVIEHADAGHRPVFPGEAPYPWSSTFEYGGSDEADASLGAQALATVLEVLRGRVPEDRR